MTTPHPSALFARARELGIKLSPRQENRRAAMLAEREQQRLDAAEDFDLQAAIEREEHVRAQPKPEAMLPRARPKGERGQYVLVPPEMGTVAVHVGRTDKVVCRPPAAFLADGSPREELDKLMSDNPGVVLAIGADDFESDPLKAIRDAMTEAQGAEPLAPHFEAQVLNVLRGRCTEQYSVAPYVPTELLGRWLASPAVKRDKALRDQLQRLQVNPTPPTKDICWPRLQPAASEEQVA